MYIYMYIYVYIRGRRFPSPFTVGTRAKIPVALYRRQEAEDYGFLYRGHEGKILVARYRGHEGQDFGRPLPWARGRRLPSPFTVGPRLMIPVAHDCGHEAEDSRRPLPWARGRSPVVFTVSRRTVGTRSKVPVVSTVSRNPALAFYRGDEGEDSRRP